MRKGPRSRLAGIVLISLLLAAPAAFASPLEETVESVTSPLPGKLPEIPRDRIPAPPVRSEAPPVRSEAPATPSVDLPPVQLPAGPPASEELPSEEASAGAPSTSEPVDGLVREARDVADTLAERQGPTGQGRLAGVAPSATKGAAGAEPTPGTARTVEPGREAPLRRWLTYVWPAVALGPFGELLTALPGSVEAVAGVSPSELRRMLSALQTGAGVGAGEEIGSPSPAAAPQSSPRPSPPPVSIPVGGAISALILIVASACLLALLLFAVRQELGATDQWWPH